MAHLAEADHFFSILAGIFSSQYSIFMINAFIDFCLYSCFFNEHLYEIFTYITNHIQYYIAAWSFCSISRRIYLEGIIPGTFYQVC